jgi:hypothetical protein
MDKPRKYPGFTEGRYTCTCNYFEYIRNNALLDSVFLLFIGLFSQLKSFVRQKKDSRYIYLQVLYST